MSDEKSLMDEHGFTIAPRVLATNECAELLSVMGPFAVAGRRGLLAVPSVVRLARSPGLLALVRPHLSAEPFSVRALGFNKSPEANWLVPWHQDSTIAVRARVEAPGFGPWSVKDGVPHVRPPVELLGRMLTVRIHLDDADESNGALRVLPGSHRLGLLPPDRIQELRARGHDILCRADAGDALLMRPLLLHASGRSTSTRERRVLHLEYASSRLPHGLEWAEPSS